MIQDTDSCNFVFKIATNGALACPSHSEKTILSIIIPCSIRISVSVTTSRFEGFPFLVLLLFLPLEDFFSIITNNKNSVATYHLRFPNHSVQISLTKSISPLVTAIRTPFAVVIAPFFFAKHNAVSFEPEFAVISTRYHSLSGTWIRCRQSPLSTS